MKSGRTKAVAPTSTLLWGWEGSSVQGQHGTAAAPCTGGRLSIALLPAPGNHQLRAPRPALEPWQGGWCLCQLLEALGSQGADVVYWGCTGQTPPCCRCRLAAPLGAGSSFAVQSPSPSCWGEHQPLPWEHSLSPCFFPHQVPQRRVPAWCSWWTCGTPTSLLRSAKPLTSSSPRDGDGAAGVVGSRAAVPAQLRHAWTPTVMARGLGVQLPRASVNGNCHLYQHPSLYSHRWLQGLFSNTPAHRLPPMVCCSTTPVRVMLLLCFAVFRSRVTKPRVFV